ncbi:MAG: aminoglycoside phosphotransferase family protein [Kofleriaceae bacterium]|nr:aminoglycoside phosphotransferase family protein [Kofleriaceae bacterium]
MLAAWGWRAEQATPLAGGLINATFAIRDGDAPVAVLQRLHPVFGAEVNLDLEAVTAHLAARGLTTPRLRRTVGGDAWVEDGGVWRALTWVDGTTVHAVPDPRWATAGGELVGRFHRAVDDLRHDYHFARAGVHDTAAHLARLQARLDGDAATAGDGDGDGDAATPALIGDARALGAEIVATAADLPPLDPAAPRRHVHGDLKLSNLLFDDAGATPRGICLLDLDTLGRGTLAFELGDAMRSWCNPRGEDEAAARFELPIFAAAIAAWRDVVGDRYGRDELASVAVGLETVCVELAARFCVDVFDDAYFGWDPARFGSRRAHNLVRARGQLALGRQVRDHRDALLAALLA